jgi:hypothetical protein
VSTPSSQIQARMNRLEELIEALEKSGDEASRNQARELVQTLLELHATGMNRMLEISFEADHAGQALIDQLAQDCILSIWKPACAQRLKK